VSQSALDRPERPTATDALTANGLNGERLLKLARRIANDAQRQAPAGLAGKYEDLVSFLYTQACEAAVKYDHAISGNGYSFSSYLCDIMERRVPDFYRRKSEGFGDRRSGNDNRIDLTAEHEDFDTDYDFDGLLRERRMAQWQKAADQAHMPVEEWLMHVADQAAARQLKQAA